MRNVLWYMFQGSLKIYKIPLPDDIEDTTMTGGDPSMGLFGGLPSNDPIHVLVRVYVVKVSNITYRIRPIKRTVLNKRTPPPPPNFLPILGDQQAPKIISSC